MQLSVQLYEEKYKCMSWRSSSEEEDTCNSRYSYMRRSINACHMIRSYQEEHTIITMSCTRIDGTVRDRDQVNCNKHVSSSSYDMHVSSSSHDMHVSSSPYTCIPLFRVD